MPQSVDKTKFIASIEQLARLSGRDIADVLVAENAKVMETAIRYTPKATREKIKEQITKDTKFRFSHHRSDVGFYYVNKSDGKEWFSPGEYADKWFLITKWHVPPDVWAAYLQILANETSDFEATLDRRLKEALARRGLAAKTWVQAGEAAGGTVNAPGYIKGAKAKEGIGSGEVTAQPSKATVSGENASLMLNKTRTGQGIVDRAIRARMKYIETSIEKGALRSMKNRAHSFPEIFKEAA